MNVARLNDLAIRALAASFLLSLTSCGGGGSSPAPTPTPVSRANLTATISNAAAIRDGATIQYQIPITVTDSGGVSSTLTTTEVTAFAGSTNLGTGTFDHTPAISPFRVAANGTARYTLTAGTVEGNDVLITRVEVRVNYRDDNANNGTATAASDIAPPPAAPVGQFTLSGAVVETPGDFVVRCALVQIVSGANSGRSVTADTNGRFSFDSLAGGALTLRVSKAEYTTSDTALTLNASTTVTIRISKAG